MIQSLKSILINRFFIGLYFLIATIHLSAQTISYDSIQDDGTRNDILTFVEDFADDKYELNSLFVSEDSLSFQLKKINANGAISATVADDTLSSVCSVTRPEPTGRAVVMYSSTTACKMASLRSVNRSSAMVI